MVTLRDLQDQLEFKTFDSPGPSSPTIKSERMRITAAAINGAEEKCPVCNRLMKVYKRNIHAEMIIWLIELCKLTEEVGSDWHTTVEIIKCSQHLKAGGTNGTLLVHWGLIEKIPEENRAGGPAGRYRITEKGFDFLYRKGTVPERVHFFCDKVIGYSEEHVSVKQALGKRFNYQELMDA